MGDQPFAPAPWTDAGECLVLHASPWELLRDGRKPIFLKWMFTIFLRVPSGHSIDDSFYRGWIFIVVVIKSNGHAVGLI